MLINQEKNNLIKVEDADGPWGLTPLRTSSIQSVSANIDNPFIKREDQMTYGRDDDGVLDDEEELLQ